MSGELKAIESLERKIEEQIEKANKARTQMIVVVGVLIVLLGGYLTVLGNQVESLANPQDVAGMTADAIKNQIPGIRRQVAAEIKAQAPKALDRAVDNFLAEIPKGRTQVHKLVDALVDDQMRSINHELDVMLDEALDKHGPEIRGLLREIKQPDGQKRFEDFMYETLSEQLAHPTMRTDIEGYGIFLVRLANRLDEIVVGDPAKLTSAQRAERDFIISLREISNRSPKYKQTKIDTSVSDETVMSGQPKTATPSPKK